MPIPLGVLAVAGAGAGGLTNDYEHIATFEASTNTEFVNFTNIPQTYRHLQIRHSIRTGQSGNTNFAMTVNATITDNLYDTQSVAGNTSSAFSNTDNSLNRILVPYAVGAGAGTGQHGAGIIDILDYTSTSKTKVFRVFGGARTNNSGLIAFGAGLFRSTSAVTRLGFTTTAAGELLIAGFQGTSRISLYGIKG
jgi:hypothetical protein